MKTNPRKTPTAFTLVELLAVITIIVILAGLIVSGVGFIKQRQATETAKLQMALLSKALEEYKLDMGSYPGSGDNFGGTATGTSGDYSKVLYTALFYDGYEYTKQANPPPNWEKATKIYLPELNPTTSKQGWTSNDDKTSDDPGEDLEITDPWEKGYHYRIGSNAQNPDFDLWSYGKDGKSNDDLKHKDSLDDIRNF